ncbi:MAG: uroporphyrinogen decarboxylase family protein [Anaerolineae bacterium]
MTSREIVQRAIEFRHPERLPLSFPLLGFSDLYGVGYKQAAGWAPREPGVDEWGCPWQKTIQPNMGQVRDNPLKDWAAMDSYDFPDPCAPGRFDDIERQLQGAGDKYVLIGSGFTLFERAHFLHGYAETLQDMYLHPNEVHQLLDHILEFQLGIVTGAKRFQGAIDGFMMTDDWGTQLGPMIGLPLWREFFRPRYQRLFAAIREAGLHSWLHSCGRINAIIGDLIEIGLDVVEVEQPRVLGIEEVGRLYGGRICFETVVDIQQTIPSGTLENIRAEARLLWEHWASARGGLVIKDYSPRASDDASINYSYEKRLAMFEAFWKVGATACGALPTVSVPTQ